MSSKVIARWTFNAKFGKTREAFGSISNWCKNVGFKAWTQMKWSQEDINNRVTILQGSIGAIEQRFEMRVEFDSVSDIDKFFGCIPGKDHMEWGAQHAQFIEGNTHWEIYRTKPIQWA